MNPQSPGSAPEAFAILPRVRAQLETQLDQSWAELRDWARAACPFRQLEFVASLDRSDPAGSLARLSPIEAATVVHLARVALTQTHLNAFAPDPAGV